MGLIKPAYGKDLPERRLPSDAQYDACEPEVREGLLKAMLDSFACEQILHAHTGPRFRITRERSPFTSYYNFKVIPRRTTDDPGSCWLRSFYESRWFDHLARVGMIVKVDGTSEPALSGHYGRKVRVLLQLSPLGWGGVSLHVQRLLAMTQLGADVAVLASRLSPYRMMYLNAVTFADATSHVHGVTQRP